MLNVSKKVKFLSIVLGSLLAVSTSVFAQSFDLDNSAVKRATAGQFKSDSDYIKASDIFDSQRAFFSAGYLGKLYSGQYFDGKNSVPQSAVQASFGIPFANGMYFGLIGAYNFNDSAVNNNNTAINNTYKINSQLALRAALRINEMVAVHYFLGLTPKGGLNSLYQNKHIKQDENNDYRIIDNHGNWTHEIAAALKINENMKLVIPVGLVFNADSTTTKGKINGIDVDMTQYAGDNPASPNDYVAMYINPELDITMTDKGPLTGVNVGLDIGFNVDNNIGMVGKQEGEGVKFEQKVEYKKHIFNISPWVSAPLEWSLSGDKVKLAMEPKFQLGIDVDIYNGYKFTINGEVQPPEDKNKLNNTTITPTIEVPIGTLWRPVEWYELRFGTAMILGASFDVHNSNPEQGEKSSGFNYNSYSGIAAYFGMGFIVGEDFNIDLYGSMGTGNADLVDLANFGGQLTYRF